MSYGDLEERPAKKRRFFVDESPGPDRTLKAEASLPDEINSLSETGTGATAASGHVDGIEDATDFDVSLLENFVGEPLPPSTIEKLKELSGNSVERGKFGIHSS
jgi:DNA repair protein RAD5